MGDANTTAISDSKKWERKSHYYRAVVNYLLNQSQENREIISFHADRFMTEEKLDEWLKSLVEGNKAVWYRLLEVLRDNDFYPKVSIEEVLHLAPEGIAEVKIEKITKVILREPAKEPIKMTDRILLVLRDRGEALSFIEITEALERLEDITPVYEAIIRLVNDRKITLTTDNKYKSVS